MNDIGIIKRAEQQLHQKDLVPVLNGYRNWTYYLSDIYDNFDEYLADPDMKFSTENGKVYIGENFCYTYDDPFLDQVPSELDQWYSNQSQVLDVIRLPWL